MRPVKAVVFDLDGTLVRSKVNYEEMARRIREILLAAGVPNEILDGGRRRIWEIIMGGERLLRDLGTPPEEVRGVLDAMTSAMNSVEMETVGEAEPMPNAVETLKALRGMGIGVGVATRGCSAYATRSLEITGMIGSIDTLLARDEVPHPKPDPRHLLQVIELLKAHPEEVIYVGDTSTDMLTAKGAKIRFVGYKRDEEWGRRLVEAGCDRVIEDLREVVDVVSEINGAIPGPC